jgi:hypothetical protein
MESDLERVLLSGELPLGASHRLPKVPISLIGRKRLLGIHLANHNLALGAAVAPRKQLSLQLRMHVDLAARLQLLARLFATSGDHNAAMKV